MVDLQYSGRFISDIDNESDLEGQVKVEGIHDVAGIFCSRAHMDKNHLYHMRSTEISCEKIVGPLETINQEFARNLLTQCPMDEYYSCLSVRKRRKQFV